MQEEIRRRARAERAALAGTLRASLQGIKADGPCEEQIRLETRTRAGCKQVLELSAVHQHSRGEAVAEEVCMGLEDTGV